MGCYSIEDEHGTACAQGIQSWVEACDVAQRLSNASGKARYVIGGEAGAEEFVPDTDAQCREHGCARWRCDAEH
jgi:hypothetical protein